MRILLLVIALAAAVVGTNARADFTHFLDGSTLPGALGWTVDGDAGTLVDLGGGNSGIRQVDDDPGEGGGQHRGSYDEYYLTVRDPSNTLGARFRLEEYTPGDNLTTLLALTAGNSENTPAIGLGIRNVEGVDRWQLVRFIFESNNPGNPDAILHDIAPVTLNEFNEALIHIDSDTDLVRFSWNGMELYNMVTPTDFGGNDGFPEFGASNFWGEGGTSTVTYDWVGYGPGYIPPAGPAMHTWNVDANGNWSLASNWTGGQPNAVGASASFLGAITAARTITVDGPKTVGSLTFNNTNSYTLAGPGPLTIDSATASAIEVTGGSHTISAPLSIADNTVFTIGPATSNLSITGAVSAGGVTLTKAGAGTLTLNNVRAAGLSVNGGTVAIAPNAGAPALSTSVLNTITIAGANDAWTAKLDLTNNDAVIQSTAANKAADFARLYNQIKQGFNNGTWTGLGITSATAAGNPSTDTGIAVVDNALLGLTTFSGQTVTADSIVLKYTYYGDIDQNGQVDADDLTVFATNFGRAAGATQIDGDIDFNGAVNADDLTVFANNFNKGVGNPLGVGAVQAVPEPASWALGVLAAASIVIGTGIRRRFV